MISLPIAVNTPIFYPQLSLFDYAHQITQGTSSGAIALILDRNYAHEPKNRVLDVNLSIDYEFCVPYFEFLKNPPLNTGVNLPLNTQSCLLQFIGRFSDDDVIELLDCDMIHLKKKPDINVEKDEIYVDNIYEDWHLKSLSENRHIISKYFSSEGNYYNGGFLPIIGKVKTFKKILRDWIDIHIDIVNTDYQSHIKWWANMFALQAACEKNRVQMIHKNFCYISGTNLRPITEETYIAHYSVDQKYNKKLYPIIDTSNFEDNIFYDIVRDWVKNVWRKND